MQVSSWGYHILPVSVRTGRGLSELAAALAGEVAVVAGPSGAGKSSIINALRLRSLGLEATLEAQAAAPSLGREEAAGGGPGDDGAADGEAAPEQQGAADGGQSQERRRQQGAEAAAACDAPEGLELQAVGEVSQRIGRGKHTTRNVSLLELTDGGGLLVDTPGFNQPELHLPAVELAACFPEVRRLQEAGRCAFRSCQHLHEPGCVVREAGWERYPLYAEIHGELRALEAEEAARAAGKRQREGAVRYKSRAGGTRGAEARLEAKSYRRVSRRSARQRLGDLAREVEAEEE